MRAKLLMSTLIFFLVATAAGFLSVSLAAGTKKTTASQAPKKKLGFQRTVYATADDGERITMMSSSELEIGGRNGNFVATYSREGSVIRAVLTLMGQKQAVYYDVVADGLRDRDGKMFYSAAALERVKRAAESDARQAVRSKQPTRTLMEFQAFKWSHSSSEVFSGKVTDVGIFYTSNTGGNYDVPFHDMNLIEIRACNNEMHPCDVILHTTSYYKKTIFSFDDDAKRREFVAQTDAAVWEWKTKYPRVEQRKYVGVRDKAQ